jgi:hypothetical protein
MQRRGTAKSGDVREDYGDLCFGVFALSVEIRRSAAGGTTRLVSNYNILRRDFLPVDSLCLRRSVRSMADLPGI